MIFYNKPIFAQEIKSEVWKPAECGPAKRKGDYDCSIHIWGQNEGGEKSLFTFVEKTERGIFSAYLSQTTMLADVGVKGGKLIDDYYFTVDGKIPLKFSPDSLTLLLNADYPIITIKIPLTHAVFTYLENSQNIIEVRFASPTRKQTYARFKVDGLLEQLGLMAIQTNIYRIKQ